MTDAIWPVAEGILAFVGATFLYTVILIGAVAWVAKKVYR